MKDRVGIKWKEISLKSSFKNFYHKHKKLFWYAVAGVLIILLLIPPLTYLYFAKDLKDKETIINRGKTGLTLLDRDGQQFFTFFQPKEIRYIRLDQIPEHTKQAVIAAEDKNFYTNPGFSIRGIARAFVTNLFAGRIVEGGSTITQELAKNVFLNSGRNYLRKYQELVLAAELNRRFSKEDILEMYLNSVYFGEGAFGIENAALSYFGKTASDLTLEESALLVAILPAPSAFSPLSNDDTEALRRQKIVLDEMVEDGYISQTEANQTAGNELSYNPQDITKNNNLAPHFAVYIKNVLIEKYGEERIIREGFKVTTTLDSAKQEFAETTVKNRVLALRSSNASNSAAIAINPQNGEILVMVGSYDWFDEEYGKTNMALIPRQPGSSFKPIIYADAIERRLITASSILEDEEKTFPGNYEPKNYDERFRGSVTVRRALANSLNIPAVEVMEKVGVKNGLNRAEDFGITTLKNESDYGLSLVLGTGEVPLLEMTAGYAALANSGIYHKPKAIIEIENKYGEVIDQRKWYEKLFSFFRDSESKKSISEETAFIISHILSDNNARAETFGGSLTVNRTAAVKTGTTEDYRDALTIGYTPNLAIGVWVGNNDNSPMNNVAGSLGAAPVWRNLMNNFLTGTEVIEFKKPTFVVEQRICSSFFRPYLEYYISGTQPKECGAPSATTTPTGSGTPTPTEEPGDEENSQEEETEDPTPTPTTQPASTATPTQNPTSTPQPTVAITIP